MMLTTHRGATFSVAKRKRRGSWESISALSLQLMTTQGQAEQKMVILKQKHINTILLGATSCFAAKQDFACVTVA